MTNELVDVVRARAFVASGTGRAIRKAARLSLAELGQALGVDQSTVYRWETGERTPRAELAVRYAGLLRELMSAR